MRNLLLSCVAFVCMGVAVHPSVAQENTFDKNLFLELTTELKAGKHFDIAVDMPAWVDFDANEKADDGEVFVPDVEGKIQRFIAPFKGKGQIKIYGAFKELILREDGITSIDVHRMTQLTYLELKANKLTTIDLSALKNLESLSVRENDFTSLDLSHQPKLELLEVIYNRFESLDLANNPNMYFLGIAHNRFSEKSIERILGDLPTRDRKKEGDIFAHFPLETEHNVITTDQVLRAKERFWNVYTWSIAANNWVPYAGVRGLEDVWAESPFKVNYHNGNLMLYGTKAGAEVAIYDLSGTCLATFSGDAETTLYRHFLSDGVYIIKQGIQSAKLMVTTK